MQAHGSPSPRTTSEVARADARQGVVLWWYAMTRARPRLPRWLSAVVLAAVVFGAVPALGQGPSAFRITHSLDKGTQPQVTVSGRVFNDARADAIDVYVAADALDASGKEIASGDAYDGTISSGSSSAFAVKIPSARSAASCRVQVTTYRFGFANQS